MSGRRSTVRLALAFVLATVALSLPSSSLAAITLSETGSTITVESTAVGVDNHLEIKLVTVGPPSDVVDVIDHSAVPEGFSSVDCLSTLTYAPKPAYRCVVNAPAVIVVNGGPGNDTLDATNVPRMTSMSGGDGNDTLTGGSANGFIVGDAGDDVLRGSGASLIHSGGEGSDTFFPGLNNSNVGDTGTIGTDVLDLRQDPRTTGVKFRLEGGALKVYGEGDTQVFTTGGLERIHGTAFDDEFVLPPVSIEVYAGAGNDRLLGNTAPDLLHGEAGNDYLEGAAGQDLLRGGPGDDELRAFDGYLFDGVACEEGNDVAYTDVLESASACETVLVGAGPGVSFPPVTLIAGVLAQGPLPKGQARDELKGRMPDFVRGHQTLEQAQTMLQARGFNVRWTLKPVGLARFRKVDRPKVVPGEVLFTRPVAGARIDSGVPGPVETITVSYYDPKLPKGADCPYATGDVETANGDLDVWRMVSTLSLDDGARMLDDLDCRWRVVKTKRLKPGGEAAYVEFKPGKLNGRPMLNVTLGLPAQPDFRALFTQPVTTGAARQVGMMRSGAIAASDNTYNVSVLVLERASARVVAYLPVRLFDQAGNEIAAGRTGHNGAVHLNFATRQRVGLLRLVMELEDPRNRGDVLMSAVQQIKIEKPTGAWIDLNGNTMVRDAAQPKKLRWVRNGTVGTRFGRSTRASYRPVNQIIEAAEQALAMDQQVGSLTWRELMDDGRFRAALNAIRTGNSVEEIVRDSGFGLGLIGNSVLPLGAVDFVQPIRSASVFMVADPNGLVGNDGASIVSRDGAGLIGTDSGGVMPTGAGSLVAAGGGNLISDKGWGLVGQDGSTLVGQDGSTIVAAGGGNLVAAGGGNLRLPSAGELLARSSSKFGGLARLPRAVAVIVSSRYVADARSHRVVDYRDSSLIANSDGTVPITTLVATGPNVLPVILPGKLL